MWYELTAEIFTLLYSLHIVSSRLVNMEIVGFPADKVLHAFTKCLQSLPDLQTLKITSIDGQLATAMGRFQGPPFLADYSSSHSASHLSNCPQVRMRHISPPILLRRNVMKWRLSSEKLQRSK
jgi:hypothetical protein